MAAYAIGTPVWNLMFGEKFPAVVNGEPHNVLVTNRAGRTFEVTQQSVVTLRHTLTVVDPTTGEITKASAPYVQERDQSVNFLRIRPIDGTETFDPAIMAKVKYEPVEGLDYVDIDGVQTALTIADLSAISGASTSAWQANKRANQVDLSTR